MDVYGGQDVRLLYIPLAEGEYLDLSQGKKERNGFGTYNFNNGMIYSGFWAKDQMSGQG